MIDHQICNSVNCVLRRYIGTKVSCIIISNGLPCDSYWTFVIIWTLILFVFFTKGSMIFGYRNHNTTNSSFRLIGTTHTDCGNAPNNINNNSSSSSNNLLANNNTIGSSVSSSALCGIGNIISSGIISNSIGGSSSTTTTTTTVSRPSNYYTSRSVSWNTNGSYLAVAGSALTVRLLNVEYGTTTSKTNSVEPIIPGSNNNNNNTNMSDSSISGNTAQQQQHQQQLLTGKEVVAITTGNGGNNVTKVRFHPNDTNVLCSSDTIVQLWDVRGNVQRTIGKINIHANGTAIAIDWNTNPSNNNIIQITERDNSIYIYDIRKLSSLSSSVVNKSNTASTTTTNNSLCCFKMKQSVYVDTCLFTPDGTSIITGTTSRENGIGQLRIFPWMYNNNIHNHVQPMTLPQITSPTNDNNIVSATYSSNYVSSDSDGTTGTSTSSSTGSSNTKDIQCNVYSGHAGPIYAMSYSSNKQYLATGGSDASVVVWDVNSMCCIQSITRRLKFIRSVAFSSDNTILATSSEEDTIDLSHIPSGQLIGLSSFTTTSTPTTGTTASSSTVPTTSNNRRSSHEGAEEITFHPSKDVYILACARTSIGPISTPPVAILKLHISQ
jgi:WD40 repeat protein